MTYGHFVWNVFKEIIILSYIEFLHLKMENVSRNKNIVLGVQLYQNWNNFIIHLYLLVTAQASLLIYKFR